MPTHILNGKSTSHGHNVHYTDHDGDSHAATIVDLEHGDGGHHADLAIIDRETGHSERKENVPFSATPKPHTWSHIPE
jgi:hypothetical protein